MGKLDVKVMGRLKSNLNIEYVISVLIFQYQSSKIDPTTDGRHRLSTWWCENVGGLAH